MFADAFDKTGSQSPPPTMPSSSRRRPLVHPAPADMRAADRIVVVPPPPAAALQVAVAELPVLATPGHTAVPAHETEWRPGRSRWSERSLPTPASARPPRRAQIGRASCRDIGWRAVV